MALRIFRASLLLLNLLGATAYTPLSDETLKNLPGPGTDFDVHTGSILSPILIPRVPGTPGSLAVQKHFTDWFSKHLPKWTIEIQHSTATTPATGDEQVPFSNIIITRDPPWAKPGEVGRLALVAHYDSKLTPTGFIGATDSAAPCAIIMHVARSVDDALTQQWASMEADGTGGDGLTEEKGVQIILLDGEEAFVKWSATDSLYGARALAEEWEATQHSALSTYKTALDSISLFVLLDLLGAPKPNVPSYFQTTHWAYQGLAGIETRLRSLNLLKSTVDGPFLPDGYKGSNTFSNYFGMQDDHLPFMARGVDILHIIPSPFPDAWHKIWDDAEHLDAPTVEDWAQIFTAFVGEWMDLEGHFPLKAQAQAKARGQSATSSKTEL